MALIRTPTPFLVSVAMVFIGVFAQQNTVDRICREQSRINSAVQSFVIDLTPQREVPAAASPSLRSTIEDGNRQRFEIRERASKHFPKVVC